MQNPKRDIYSELTTFQKICMRVIKCGPIPKHIAFILDGNRRYASKNNFPRERGHYVAYDRVWDVLGWCGDLGVKEATIYTFSIANLKRTPEEVESLIEMCKEKFEQMLHDEESLMVTGIRIRIIGNVSYMRADVREAMAKVVKMTKRNTNLTLNMAFMYTSHDEIEQAAKAIVQGVQNGDVQLEDIDEELFSDCLYTYGSSNPDIIVRTSGEVRFSDFLLWQTSNSQMSFIENLWPDITLWDLLKAVFNYQRSYKELKGDDEDRVRQPNKEHVQKFVEKLQQQRNQQFMS